MAATTSRENTMDDLQPISRDSDNNDVMLQKELMSDLG